MNVFKEIANSLEELYLERENIPTIWREVTAFYADNVFPDLIALGEKIHVLKEKGVKNAIFASIMPSTERNFQAFDKKMNNLFPDETPTPEEEEIEDVVDDEKYPLHFSLKEKKTHINGVAPFLKAESIRSDVRRI
jgi:hypothetical protein